MLARGDPVYGAALASVKAACNYLEIGVVAVLFAVVRPGDHNLLCSRLVGSTGISRIRYVRHGLKKEKVQGSHTDLCLLVGASFRGVLTRRTVPKPLAKAKIATTGGLCGGLTVAREPSPRNLMHIKEAAKSWRTACRTTGVRISSYGTTNSLIGGQV